MELKDLTTEQLLQLRKEIVLNSLYISDYENSFGIDPHIVCDFFEGYVMNMEDLWKYEFAENRYNYEQNYFDNEDNYWNYFVENEDNLIDFFNSIEWGED